MNTHLTDLQEIIQVSETLGMLAEKYTDLGKIIQISKTLGMLAEKCKCADPSCHQLEMVNLIKERQKLVNVFKTKIELKD